jgi:hypothetical protein
LTDLRTMKSFRVEFENLNYTELSRRKSFGPSLRVNTGMRLEKFAEERRMSKSLVLVPAKADGHRSDIRMDTVGRMQS